MTTGEAVVKALEGFEFPVVYNTFDGRKTEYVTYNYLLDYGDDFGDNAPEQVVKEIQVHYFAPKKTNKKAINHEQTIKEIREALFRGQFTYPSIHREDEPENNLTHIIYECSFIEER